MIPQIPDYSRASVLVVGDVMLDRYWYGSSSRVSPEAPVPVVHLQDEELRAGGAGNVGLNVAALGAYAKVLGLVGDDADGDLLRNCLSQKGIDTGFLVDSAHKTVSKYRVISRNQQLLRLDFEDGFSQSSRDALMQAYLAELSTVAAVVISDYGKGGLGDVPAMIQAARVLGLPVLVDPKGTDFERYRGATLITPNRSEFEAVVGGCHDEQELMQRGYELVESLELGGLLVTRSEQGMSLLMEGEKPLHLPTHAQQVFDVTGAGDTVIAVLAAGLAAGEPIREATALANVAAGIVVGKLGAETVRPDELRRTLHGDERDGFGVVDEARLLDELASARSRGERIVMTNGCFDLLHPGHVSYLQQASALGDRLIVAVNDDDSVRRLEKGEGRPLNTLDHRMTVLAGLRSVDWVVAFTEDTPARLIAQALPDLLVKGGDYQPKQIAGYDSVVSAGGEVRVLDFVEGYSTTSMINSMKKTN